MLSRDDGGLVMTVVRYFPINGRLLMVKWTSRFLFPWITRRSSGVTSFLQQVPAQGVGQLNRLTRTDI